MTPQERFWRHVEIAGEDDCWAWTGGRQGKGYGQFWLSHGQPLGAHRYAWMIANGRPIPPGNVVMHSCDNPPCVNPAHLRVGTVADNARDCAAKGRNPGNRTRARRQSVLEPHRTRVVTMLAAGRTQRAVARHFGVSQATMSRFVSSLSQRLVAA